MILQNYAENLLKFASLAPDQQAEMQAKAQSMGREFALDVTRAGDYRDNVRRAASLQQQLDELGEEQYEPVPYQPVPDCAKVSGAVVAQIQNSNAVTEQVMKKRSQRASIVRALTLARAQITKYQKDKVLILLSLGSAR